MPDDNPFTVLPREAAPPPHLRARILSDLRHRGLVPPGPSRLVRGALALAAGILLFLAGTLVGGREAPGEQPTGQPYVLLLYAPTDGGAPIAHDAAAAEYRTWAAGLGSQFVAGDALGAQRVLGGTVGDQIPTGYFVIRAENWDGAMAIARDCPHLRRGGVVAVRAIMN